ncbi:odorant receptor Or1-like [Anopheles aquasalis]|uniref:odorant receptor Or1-like n=1 Tax=Anopheles aquasalis TaxID=42839 RepID=UPI00215A46A0|nr:odorant receptor Or1-like [Anopheles aquasalis]
MQSEGSTSSKVSWKRFPSFRMMLLVFRIFYAWPKREMDVKAGFWYRLKGILFRVFFIYLNVVLQVVFVFTDAPIQERIATVSVLFTEIVVIWKLEFFYHNVKKIQELVYRLDEEMYRPQSDAEAEILVFPCWFPYDFNSSLWLYSVTIVYQYLAITFNASFNIACDSLVGNLLALVDANLQRLEIQLKKVGHPNIEDKILIVKPADCNKNLREATNHELLKCIIFHQELTGYLSDILNMFGAIVTLQLFCSVFILCITELHLLANEHSLDDLLRVVMYLCCLVMQVFISCHYGNEITYTSKRVHQATAFVNYPDMDIKTRKLLILFQQRTAPDLKCYAELLFKIELSMDTFVMVIKSSYSYLAVLQSMTD